jgi:tetratricopeptide (TPR) repeat protein
VLASPRAAETDQSSAEEALAELYYEAGDYEKPAERFESAMLREPDDDSNHWNTLLWLGNCYEGMGAHDEAKNCYEQNTGLGTCTGPG